MNNIKIPVFFVFDSKKATYLKSNKIKKNVMRLAVPDNYCNFAPALDGNTIKVGPIAQLVRAPDS